LLGTYAWYDSNSGGTTHPVGEKQPNGFGLYDMHGNVLEWCADWYDAGYYAVSPMNNPQGPASGIYRIMRGGSWANGDGNLRSAFRASDVPGLLTYFIGCRCAKTP
jgi:formylglycine-generating enzyme required for sulfatase activity